jgi:hypothetical protein
VFDRALPLAKQGGQSALAAEAPDYPLGGVCSLFHGRYPNEFFVIVQVRARKGQDDISRFPHGQLVDW